LHKLATERMLFDEYNQCIKCLRVGGIGTDATFEVDRKMALPAHINKQ